MKSLQDQPRYPRALAAELADISLEFLKRCEAEGLIEVRTVEVGESSYRAQDIRRLALIRRLHNVLGIHFEDLEVVLHLRDQLIALQELVQFMERRYILREEKLLRDLGELRRQLAEDVDST